VLCELVASLVMCLDDRRVGFNDPVFGDDPFEGHPRGPEYEEEPIEDTKEGKFYPP
jgi:hypothetical protein